MPEKQMDLGFMPSQKQYRQDLKMKKLVEREAVKKAEMTEKTLAVKKSDGSVKRPEQKVKESFLPESLR